MTFSNCSDFLSTIFFFPPGLNSASKTSPVGHGESKQVTGSFHLVFISLSLSGLGDLLGTPILF